MLNFIFYHTPVFYLIQSVWRDEAFSYFMAKPNIFQVIINTANDFNPPFYYLILHFWMKFVGQSDEGLRLLSFIAHLASVYIAYIFAEKLLSKKFAMFVAAFTFLNPMLLYYAFEMRMYSFYALFTFATIYFFYVKNWKWYLIAAVLGLYTHSFFPLVLISLVVYLYFLKQFNRRNIFRVIKPFIFYLPWIPIIFIQFLNSKNSWLFPVDLQLILSSLGNLFINYEGTPGGFWGLTALLSSLIFLFILKTFRKKREGLLFSIPILLPLTVILGYSVLKRPLFVNRYMIFITVFEIMSISSGIWLIKNKTIRSLTIAFWLILVITINFTTAPYRKKTDFKSSFAEINKTFTSNDYIYAKTPIGFLESAYYSSDKNRVFVYNPAGIKIPDYIGVNIIFPNISKYSFPPAPSKTYLVSDDSNFDLVINR